VTSQGGGRVRRAGLRGFMVIALGAIFLTGMLSACGEAKSRSVRFGVYVSHLCEAIGPFEFDGQRLGRIIGRYGVDVNSRTGANALSGTLSAMSVAARRVVATLETVGAPEIDHGSTFAVAMVITFDKIEKADEAWGSKVHAGDWMWPSASRMGSRDLQEALGALLLFGRQFERLPSTRERQKAMAGSPVCRGVFGAIRVPRPPPST
jgi:hypothetical protein